MRLAAVLFALLMLASPLAPFKHQAVQDVRADSLADWSRVFHLHDGTTYAATFTDWMNSSGPANPGWTDYDADGIEGVTLRKSGQPLTWHGWNLYPRVGAAVTISGDINVRVWARAVDNNTGMVMIVRFYDIVGSQLVDPRSGVEIGNAQIPLAGPIYTAFRLCSINVTGISYTIPAGHYLSMTIERQDSTNNRLVLYYDKTDYDSYITLHTNSFVGVTEAHTEDVLGVPRSVFSDSENAVVECNVTNPFGSYDIAGSYVRVTNSTTVFVPTTSMSVVQTDASNPSYWKRFNRTLPPLPAGAYTVNVTAADAQGTPSWMDLSLTIVTVDHFHLGVPSAVMDNMDFSMTISAMDSSDAIIPNWVGTVQLQAFENDMVTPGLGALNRTTVTFALSDAGQLVVNDLNYSYSEETIRIRASSGSHAGWSSPISVHSGPVTLVVLSPAGPIEVLSGGLQTFTAEGFDSHGHMNTSWSPNWTAAGVGAISGSGLSVEFSGLYIGTGNVVCKNDLTSANDSTEVTVVPGELYSIVIQSPAYPLEIGEGETQALTAIGYDIGGNEVSLTGAYWRTTTSGDLFWTGPSATYTAGYMPETGIVNITLNGIVGTLDVVVVSGQFGPDWLKPVPAQIQNEDAGTWDFSLTGYWTDDNSTALLSWSAQDINTSLFIVSHDPYSNSIIRFSTQPDENGEDQFLLWVVDRDGHKTYQWITVRIIAVNDPPRFINSPPTQLYVRYDEPYSFDYSYYVSDVDNPQSDLSMGASLSSTSEGSISFDSLIGTFLFPAMPSRGSTYFDIVTLSVTDVAGASSDMRLVVYVTDDYPPRLNNSLPSVLLYEGDVMHYCFDLDDYFYDIDSSYLFFTYGFQHVVVFIAWNHSVYMNATEEWSGTTDGVFTATDSDGALKSDTVTITVIAVNDPPVVNMPSSIIVKYNSTYYLYLSLYVWDPDNSMDSLVFTFNDVHVKHTSSFMGGHRLEITFPGALPNSEVFSGSYMAYIQMDVTDPGGLTTSSYFTVVVTDDEPPVVIAPNPDLVYYSFAEDSYLNNSMKLYELFADPDDSMLNFTISGGLHVHSAIFANGVVNLTADVNWSGVEILTVKARDPHLGWASLQAYVTVAEVNDAPWIFPISDMIMKSGRIDAPIYILGYIVDSDDGAENLTITATPAANVAVVGGYLYVTLPHGVDVITVTVTASDGSLMSNARTFKVGVAKTMAERIGWPYSFPLVLLAAGVLGYFGASRLPRPHALENIFLIHNDGRLIAHVTKEENTTLDKDVVSAMFTAVQDFVRDSFQKGEVGLKKLEIGDRNVIIEKGQSAYVALIYSGWPHKETFDMLPMLLRDVEERFKGKIERWNGTMKAVKGVDKMLQEYMAGTYKPGVWHDEEELAEAQWVDMIEKEA